MREKKNKIKKLYTDFTYGIQLQKMIIIRGYQMRFFPLLQLNKTSLDYRLRPISHGGILYTYELSLHWLSSYAPIS